jgi:ribosomal protein S18 acetylase RimI-like enzyme
MTAVRRVRPDDREWVDPDARRRGVARMLLDATVGFARDHGDREVFVSVAEGNDPARLLYERYGFVATGERDRFDANEMTLA